MTTGHVSEKRCFLCTSLRKVATSSPRRLRSSRRALRSTRRVLKSSRRDPRCEIDLSSLRLSCRDPRPGRTRLRRVDLTNRFRLAFPVVFTV